MNIDLVKKDIIKLVKVRDSIGANVLKLALTEASKDGTPVYEQFVKSCRKITESNLETIRLGGSNDKLSHELTVLSQYIPKAATVEEIQTIAYFLSSDIVSAESDGKAIGVLSKALKERGTTADGAIMKTIVANIRSKKEQYELRPNN